MNIPADIDLDEVGLPNDERTVLQRMATGEALRKKVPREILGEWQAPDDRPDPVELLIEQGRTRVPELLPVRYGRMSVSAFTYLRGSPIVMAHDIGTARSSGVRTQLCGDAHLLNFGAYGTPERRLVFDLNDFDETLPGPFEWDVKRLVTSFVIAARTSGQGEKAGRKAAKTAAKAYRENIQRLSQMGVMDVWYEHIELSDALQEFTGLISPKQLAKSLRRTESRNAAQVLGKLTELIEGERRIRHQPPVLVPLDDPAWHEITAKMIEEYRHTLSDAASQVLNRFDTIEIALKVVGVGSVGTRCTIALMYGRDEDDVMFLQTKEAERSVLAPYAGESVYEHQGERVVNGQRLMQAASDLFLGWTTGPAGRYFYNRQLRDMKASVNVDSLSPDALINYGELCGRTMARAHARAGDPVVIAGYLGRSERFDNAMQSFAVEYADQTERDYARFLEAIEAGQISATPGL